MQKLKLKIKNLMSYKTHVFYAFMIVSSLIIWLIGYPQSLKAVAETIGITAHQKETPIQRVEAKEEVKEVKVYQYNEQVPKEVVELEIRKQAKQFGNDEDFMVKLALCESRLNNLADNNHSTAKGVYQFVANTWETTKSNSEHISEFDYIANIREANIKIANEEYSHWVDCVKKAK